MPDIKKKDFAMDKLAEFKEKHPEPERMTTSSGAPVSTRTASLTAGPRGPLLMQDITLFDELTHFDRERVPERVVHAKGAGAFGEFEVTHDITKYTKACIFGEVGKVTPLFVRFSTVAGERGSADTVRDPRGFAIKFYTEEGNWDLVANNTPIFFHRDPILFPSFIHALKRNPSTNLRDPNAFWDFLAQRPEAIHQFMFLHGDRGLPDGYRFMDGYGSHTFKLQNANGETIFCKFHLKSQQGNKFLTDDEADLLAGKDPDYASRDLLNAIEQKDFPKWNFYLQLMTNEQALKHEYNPFDVTKVWSHDEFPLIPVGTLTLNKNPDNYFAEVEQAAFSPSHLIPGIEVSPDKMLQGRLISYKDTQYHRLGPNYQQLPINCPYRARPIRNIQRDGLMALGKNQSDAPTHHPNSFHGSEARGEKEASFEVVGQADRYESGDEDNFSQPRLFWQKVLDVNARKRLVCNIASSLGKTTCPVIQEKCIQHFKNVSGEFGEAIRVKLDEKQKPSQ